MLSNKIDTGKSHPQDPHLDSKKSEKDGWGLVAEFFARIFPTSFLSKKIIYSVCKHLLVNFFGSFFKQKKTLLVVFVNTNWLIFLVHLILSKKFIGGVYKHLLVNFFYSIFLSFFSFGYFQALYFLYNFCSCAAYLAFFMF